MIRKVLAVGIVAVSVAACGGDAGESTELSGEERYEIYQEMLQARDDAYLQQVGAITGRAMTDPDSIVKTAFVICGHIAQATGPEEWEQFSTAYAQNVGLTLEQAGSIFGATIEGYCPVLENHYFSTVVKTN